MAEHQGYSAIGATGAGSAARGNARRLTAAFVIIFVFMIFEIIGGVISGSLALLADAGHMFTDAIALALAAGAQIVSARPPNSRLHYGYRRWPVLAAFVNSLALILIVVWILIEAISRIRAPTEVAWEPMLVVAVIGLMANVVAFVLLHGAEGRDLNIRGAMLHVISDLLGSVAAVIAAVVISQTNLFIIDPILSLLVAGLILQAAVRLIRESSHVLLEGAPVHLRMEQVDDLVRSADDAIEDVHDIKISQITPDHLRMTLHARIKAEADVENTLSAIKNQLMDRLGIFDATIQIETGDLCPDIAISKALNGGKQPMSGLAHGGMHHDCGGNHDAADANARINPTAVTNDKRPRPTLVFTKKV